ncbi:unnamed protein product [Rangifer tarandus platyrhynchus]|uniref:Uncharacterized protein n=2 Tax=Rangifer tarandus platyrhynchus TaxID=3082113 RepID=A0ABN9A0Q6_RANTA|nr:unnamed protein product [Rangifer tarandus platyrhynchus]CAI9714055.1 unnamed protein product [Rangifer tarandus platyrhynchus]
MEKNDKECYFARTGAWQDVSHYVISSFFKSCEDTNCNEFAAGDCARSGQSTFAGSFRSGSTCCSRAVPTSGRIGIQALRAPRTPSSRPTCAPPAAGRFGAGTWRRPRRPKEPPGRCRADPAASGTWARPRPRSRAGSQRAGTERAVIQGLAAPYSTQQPALIPLTAAHGAEGCGSGSGGRTRRKLAGPGGRRGGTRGGEKPLLARKPRAGSDASEVRRGS